jgi:hypothetical protein
MRVDLLFNVSMEHDLVTEAIIALDRPYDTAWPLDELNGALASCYDESMELPTVGVTKEGGETVGYTVANSKSQRRIGYCPQYGPDVPVAAVNDAIRSLMGQSVWPDTMAIYLYPVRLGDSPQTSGLWLADCLDYVGDDPDLDDVVFHMVRDSNHDKRVAKKFPQFQPRRFIA